MSQETKNEKTAEQTEIQAVKKTKRTLVNIPMCVACILFCLTLISIRLTSGLYAKYVNQGSGSDSARVIKFGSLTLTETGDFSTGAAVIIPGVNLTKRVQVSFTSSESATYVFVELDLASGASTTWSKNDAAFSLCSSSAPARCYMSWSVTNDWTFLSSSGGKYVFYRELAPNTSLTAADVIANEGRITVSDAITRTEMATLTDISITVRATVVQSNGFDTPAAAWTSVSAH
ncbi:MAG: hypothetical protein IIY94_06560 [Oscillospiraceae bacterium]|nr:hypothetical protein [Oscillospiraceae bacterium]